MEPRNMVCDPEYMSTSSTPGSGHDQVCTSNETLELFQHMATVLPASANNPKLHAVPAATGDIHHNSIADYIDQKEPMLPVGYDRPFEPRFDKFEEDVCSHAQILKCSFIW
jgi:hypothetical protein